MFVDSDDYMEINAVEKVVNAINDTSADIICFGMSIINKQRKIIKYDFHENGLLNKNEIEKQIYSFLICDVKGKRLGTSLCNKAIKANIAKSNIVDVNTIIGEDSVCSIACVYNANSIYFLNEYLYYYRYNSSSTSHTRKPFNLNNSKTLLNFLINQYLAVI